MAASTQREYDDTGKVVFNDYYNQTDPRAYFTALRELDYRIAGETQPVVRRVLDDLRTCRDRETVKVVDLGASYGVNAALMKCDVSLEDLYTRYGDPDIADIPRGELLERDRRYYADHERDPSLEVVGIDPASNAVDYGIETELLDQGITTNLEESPPARDDIAALRGADLVMSTGCIGYVTESSIGHLLDGTADNRPWMAHAVLRMFSFAPYEALLGERGYVTERLGGTLPQRRFASEDEQEHVIENLQGMGIDPAGKEREGWYHANVYLSRPVEDTARR